MFNTLYSRSETTPTRMMQCDLILLVQKPSEIMGPSSVSSSFSCMTVKGRVRCSTWRIRLGGFRAGDGVRRFTVVCSVCEDVCVCVCVCEDVCTDDSSHVQDCISPFSSLFAFSSISCLALSRASILLLVSSSCRARSTALRFTSLSFSASSHSFWCSLSSWFLRMKHTRV